MTTAKPMDLNYLIPHNIQELKPYVAGKTIAEVKKEYELNRISKLASNENRLGCSQLVKDAVLRALQQIQDYPDPIAGELRKKLADRHGVKESEIILAAGSESIISILCKTFFKNGENAVTADATFVGFFVQAGVRGVDLKKVPVTSDYRFDIDAILDAVDEDTKMIYIANPNNPTGTYINKKEYGKLLKGLPNHVLLVMDEAYFEYARSVSDYPNALENRPENVIVLRTFSKAYGLAGLRIGYGFADESLITEMLKTKLTFEPTTTAQFAAYAALDDQDFIEKSVETVKNGINRITRFFDLHDIRYADSISNSVLMILESEVEAVEFTQRMLERGVILRRVNAFGLPNCIRITIGTDDEMDHFEESFKKIYTTQKF